MRWERLFQDLEDQIDRETDAELEDMARDEERLRIARMTVVDRLKESTTSGVSGGVKFWLARSIIECSLVRIGRDWLLVNVNSPRVKRGTALIPIAAIRAITFDSPHTPGCHPRDPRDTGAPGVGLGSDITLSFVLRDLCRRRRQVEVWGDATEHRGTIERVGKDHVDISETYVGDRRTADGVRGASMLALAHVDLIILI